MHNVTEERSISSSPPKKNIFLALVQNGIQNICMCFFPHTIWVLEGGGLYPLALILSPNKMHPFQNGLGQAGHQPN